MASPGFEWYDYMLFALTLVISLGIGLYHAWVGGGQRTTGDYLMGGRRMGVVPVALSMVMSYISAVLVLGNPAEMYTWGSQQFLASVGSGLAYTSAAIFFVPLFFPLRVTSAFEYLQMRFRSNGVTRSGTILLMLSQCLYMGIAIYSPATALDAVTGFPTWASIILTGVVGTIYTSLGGMKAVIWTDVFQAGVMITGMVVVLIVGTNKVGGFGEVWSISGENGRLNTFKAVLLNIPGTIILYILTCLSGLVVFAYYFKFGCDPLRTDQVSSSNQILPFFIVDALKKDAPGLPGLFVAVLFSGALSTISSSLNALAAVTWKDLLERRFAKSQELQKAFINKMLVAVYGAIAVTIAFCVQFLGGHVLQASNSFVSGVSGPLLGIFVLGAFFPFSNWIGAISGAWIGLVSSMTVTIGSYVLVPYRETLPTNVNKCPDYGDLWNVTKALEEDPTDVPAIFRMSYLWFAPLGTVICVFVGVLVSILTGPERPSEQDPRLIIPWIDRIFWCLPGGIREYFYFGVDHSSVKLTDDGHYPEFLEKKPERGTHAEQHASEDVPFTLSNNTDLAGRVNRSYLGSEESIMFSTYV